MIRALALPLALIAFAASAAEPNLTPREKNGPWMLMLSSRNICAMGDGLKDTSIHLGMAKHECVRALYAAGAAHDPSKVRHEYQNPDPRCAAKGQPTIGHWYGTSCDSHGDSLGTASGFSYSCPAYESTGSCTNTLTGETARDLRDDDIQVFP